MKLPDLNVRAWLDDPGTRRTAVKAGAVVLGVIVLGVAVWAWLRYEESRGEAAMAEAAVAAQEAMAPQATPEVRARAIKTLEAVLRDHSRFSGAPQAAYLLGNLQYASGQYAAARGAYQTAIAKGATGTLKTLSAVGIGYTWEAEKNYANAAAAYEAALAASGAKEWAYEDTLVALGRSQELSGKPAAAVETYQRFLKDVPASRRADDLKTRLAELKSRTKP